MPGKDDVLDLLQQVQEVLRRTITDEVPQYSICIYRSGVQAAQMQFKVQVRALHYGTAPKYDGGAAGQKLVVRCRTDLDTDILHDGVAAVAPRQICLAGLRCESRRPRGWCLGAAWMFQCQTWRWHRLTASDPEVTQNY